MLKPLLTNTRHVTSAIASGMRSVRVTSLLADKASNRSNRLLLAVFQ
jgi:hypothetical protein